ncbi:M14 family metallocarboxypeptidase [Paenibacillus lupini]|uniref:M14 family metallopeptidase n=1 Tax=Paenibacillus lupini TaxID=1450204 RepID=UPI00141F6450|nr:M14 family metallocarboxypeptidase [Paenibacillus lupini]NIK24693.1 g-D-glutamyl-meso-diaminopimelate peptidase [Paenibacillus lupini]
MVDLSSGQYGYSELVGECDRLMRAFPFLRGYVIGHSVLGRPIVALKCGEGSRRIHMNASFHANEWITTPLLMRFVEEWAEACSQDGQLFGEQACRLYRETEVWIVPMVNPDGVQLALEGIEPGHPYRQQLLQWNKGSEQFDQWKANIRGVDLNDQFPAHWEEERLRRGMEGPGPRDFPGPFPLSEPEAQALARLTQTIPFDSVLALHTQGEEIYWNYREYEPEQAEVLADRLGEASGYKPVKLTGSDAGYKDWFIQRFRRPGFTVEAGFGANPLPVEKFEEIYAKVGPLLKEFMVLHR